MITTYQFRIKDATTKRSLKKMAAAVNVVWNFCKQTQKEALKNRPVKIIEDKKTGEKIGIPYFLSSAEMDGLVAGSSKELGLHSQTVQAVSQEYVTRRKQFKKLLRWRSKKASGWIPFKASGIRVIGNGKVVYNKKTFSYWNSRELPSDAQIKTGSFSEDKRGRWYLNLTFESDMLAIKRIADKEVGVDIGIKTLATCSDGEKIARPNLRPAGILKIKRLKRVQKHAQRIQSKSKKYHPLPKVKQERNIHAKIANTRKDYLHKESTKLVRQSSLIVVGDVPCKLMNRNKTLSGISLDSGIGMFKRMLGFKAVRDGSTYKEFSERNSTRTCSKCRTMRPRIGLGVRIWTCEKCNTIHDRDVNASINILQAYKDKFHMGHHVLIRTQDSS